MGVMGSYCQLCALPVQHDHYVATTRPDSWNIYRHTPPSCQPAFPLLPEHAWLLRAVAVARYEEDGEPAHGLVEDGVLTADDPSRAETHFVADGSDDRAVAHEFCWDLAGRPRQDELMRVARALHEWQVLTRYHEQLFDFERLLQDGRGEMLLDPAHSLANRARIQHVIDEARRVAALPFPATVEELRRGNQWEVIYHDTTLWRFRSDVPAELDTLNFDTFFRVGAHFDEPHFETMLLTLLKPLAIMLICRGKEGRWSFLGYTPDIAAVRSAVDALAQPTYFDDEPDPQWSRYFGDFHPHLAGRY